MNYCERRPLSIPRCYERRPLRIPPCYERRPLSIPPCYERGPLNISPCYEGRPLSVILRVRCRHRSRASGTRPQQSRGGRCTSTRPPPASTLRKPRPCTCMKRAGRRVYTLIWNLGKPNSSPNKLATGLRAWMRYPGRFVRGDILR